VKRPLLLDPRGCGVCDLPRYLTVARHGLHPRFGAVLRRTLASEKRAQAMRWQLRLFLALSFVFTACVALALAHVTAFEFINELQWLVAVAIFATGLLLGLLLRSL
jgi:hypothetical protein